MTPLLPHIQIETAANPSAAVIWLHGLGADGNDFAGLVPELDLSACPAIRFVFPHAPDLPVTVNGGYVMPAWYDIYAPDLVKRQDEAGIRTSEKAIQALITREVARGIPAERIVLAGFSQGCAMALHTGLRYPQKLAGIVALSGYLPLADQFAAERHNANARTPIFMARCTLISAYSSTRYPSSSPHRISFSESSTSSSQKHEKQVSGAPRSMVCTRW